MNMTDIPLAYKRNTKTNIPLHALPILNFKISGSNICFFSSNMWHFLFDLIIFSKKP